MTRKKKNHLARPRVLVLGGGVSQEVEFAGGESDYVAYTDDKAVKAVSRDNVHALVLTGGVDIGANLYGQQPHRSTQSPNQKRDLIELKVLQKAYERGIPVLGICRGSQLINAAFGGTLHQNIPDVKGTHRFHMGHDHRIDVKKGTRLARAMQVTEAWVVSIHHQAVDKVAPGFRVAARSRDGIIEAIEMVKGPWIVGVQFHPEIGTAKTDQRIFNAFVAAAARRAGLPTPKIGAKPKAKPDKKAGSAFVSSSTLDIGVRMPHIETGPFLHHGGRGDIVEGLLVAWQCFRCGIRFDDRVDHIDHMFIVHDVDLLLGMPDRDIHKMLDCDGWSE